MPQAILHSLQIGTLATWLSVAGFGGVGVAFQGRSPAPAHAREPVETELLAEDFTLGSDSSPDTPAPEVPAEPEQPAETLPAPPDLPELAEIEPLPVVPEFAPHAEIPAEAPSRPKTQTSQNPRPSTARKADAPAGKTTSATQKGSGTPGTGASGMSNSARLAAGRMPSPTYPPYARRNGQTGTVIVEFTVDSNGRVISAYAKTPSNWPLLNAEAVSTVRRWRFPPGGVMKLQRPIVFQLR